MQICDFIAAQLQILPVGKRQSCPKMDILRAKSRPLWQAGSRVLPVLYCEQSSRQSTKGLKGWDKANKVGYDLQKTIQRWPNLDFSAFRFPHGDKSSVQGFQFSVLKFFRFQSASFEVSSLLYLFQFVLQLGTKLQLLAGMNTFRIENGDQSQILKEKPVHWTLLSLRNKTHLLPKPHLN